MLTTPLCWPLETSPSLQILDRSANCVRAQPYSDRRLRHDNSGQNRTMEASQLRSGMHAAMSIASALDLTVDDVVVVHNSNRIAVRLLPCDVLARIADVRHQHGAEFEVEVVRQLADTESPIARLEPRVDPGAYVHDGFVVTFWTYYEPISTETIALGEYAQALEQLHAGLRSIKVTAPPFTDRVAEAQALVGDPRQTPELKDADRQLLTSALHTLREAICKRGATEQLLHGEPHSGNLLSTITGLRFIDLETCCRGPVEFDIAHVPEDVSERYPDVDLDLLAECRMLVLAMVATWRWERDDQLPNGHEMGRAFLSQLRRALDQYGLAGVP